ncbi:hypothetical protein UFOVP245_90 [uncultured Caudovirales phage]|uniref:Neck protein n=1 Tax=uncultured Caudovirales phage TaxID=2100421 RepID=A0A6J7WSU5_9CAUD|nr:hypothetical protein UFOVP245_90 [uncultured Caudovirales phage]
MTASREEFKEYCLRKLGKPVIEINVDDDQVEDRVDEALSYYWDYHFDGTEKIYYKHLITDADIANKYITLPQNIIGAVNIFDVGEYISVNNIFNIRYQIALNDLYTLTYQSMVPYYMAFQQIQLLEQLLVGKQPIRYNRNVNKLYVDMNWDKVSAGYYLIVEAYQIVDPNEYSDVWNDRWLKRYATALIKKQWGSNLTKFNGMQLPGGVTFNGEKIYNDAHDEVDKLETEMTSSYSLPVTDMIG